MIVRVSHLALIHLPLDVFGRQCCLASALNKRRPPLKDYNILLQTRGNLSLNWYYAANDELLAQ